MRTEHCRRAVFTALGAIPSIVAAEVRMGEVTVEHAGDVTVAALRDAIAVAGYSVTGGTTVRSLPMVAEPGDTPMTAEP